MHILLGTLHLDMDPSGASRPTFFQGPMVTVSPERHPVRGPNAAEGMHKMRAVIAALPLLVACAAVAGAPERSAEAALGFVTRTEVAGPDVAAPASPRSYLLRSLEDSTRWVRFDFFASEAEVRRAGGEAYRLRFRTAGPAPLPTHAVFAEWQLEDASAAAAFEQSRRDLFALRAEHLEGFHADLLLQSLSESNRYLILGLYAGEESLYQARSHPAIRAFAQQNPPARFGARDLYGVRNFQIAQR